MHYEWNYIEIYGSMKEIFREVVSGDCLCITNHFLLTATKVSDVREGRKS